MSLEELKLKADSEESDSKYLGLQKKVIREKRNLKFNEKWLEKIKNSPKVKEFQEKEYSYYLVLDNGYRIDFYPKANKLLIRNQNKWLYKALNWLINKLDLQ